MSVCPASGITVIDGRIVDTIAAARRVREAQDVAAFAAAQRHKDRLPVKSKKKQKTR